MNSLLIKEGVSSIHDTPFLKGLSFTSPTYIQLVKPKEAAMAVRSERAILITVFQVSRFMGNIF